MAQWDRLLHRILRGTSDANIPFAELCQLLRHLGFDERIRGDHHIFTSGRPRDPEPPAEGSKSETIPGEASAQCHCEVQTGRRR